LDHEEGEQDAQADRLQDHVPPEVEEAGGGEVGALVVHLDGELLHLSLQAGRAINSRHLADGHEGLP